ncbi:MAG: MurR/RpiR family transcriptional regulator [Burkholderiaceae bacterium]
MQETAARCGVQPSAIIRFAQQFNLSGFSEMQALFRDEAARRLSPRPDYQDRIRSLVDSGAPPLQSESIAQEVIRGSVQSLRALESGLADGELEAAVKLMANAHSLWLVANRRAFPVGAYLAYALQHTAKPVHWLNGLGHMQQGELRAIGRHDVMIATSFEPYASETLEVVESARARGARIIAITDSRFSPLARNAAATLVAQDGETYGFRSLTAALCVAQALFIGLAYRLETRPRRKR